MTAGPAGFRLGLGFVNYRAIQFYRRSGFRLCGLDDTLYDAELDPNHRPDEVALFFTRSR